MGSTTGVDGLRRKYIIREIKPQVWVSARDAKTYEEKMIYLVPVHGTSFDTNNQDVWHKIQNC